MSEKVIRPTINELWRGVQEAKRKFPVGTEWQHYLGGVYEITGHGVDEETGEPEVRYVRARPLEDNRNRYLRTNIGDFPSDYAREVEFHRPLTKMESAGTQGPRFVRVYRTESFQTVRGQEVARV